MISHDMTTCTHNICRTEYRLQTSDFSRLTLVVAVIFFLAYEKQTRAQEGESTGSEQGGQPTTEIVQKPGYEVPLGARDPFLSPDTGIDTGQDELAASIGLLRGAVEVTIVVFGDVEGSEFAVANGTRVKIGDEVTATVTGKKIALPVKGFHRNPPGVVLEYKEREFTVYASQ